MRRGRVCAFGWSVCTPTNEKQRETATVSRDRVLRSLNIIKSRIPDPSLQPVSPEGGFHDAFGVVVQSESVPDFMGRYEWPICQLVERQFPKSTESEIFLFQTRSLQCVGASFTSMLVASRWDCRAVFGEVRSTSAERFCGGVGPAEIRLRRAERNRQRSAFLGDLRGSSPDPRKSACGLEVLTDLLWAYVERRARSNGAAHESERQ